VGVIDRAAELRNPGVEAADFEAPLSMFEAQLRECRAIDVLEGDAAGFTVLGEIVNANDIRVSQPPRRAGFRFEPGQSIRIL